jgi:hypothetical protein
MGCLSCSLDFKKAIATLHAQLLHVAGVYWLSSGYVFIGRLCGHWSTEGYELVTMWAQCHNVGEFIPACKTQACGAGM